MAGDLVIGADVGTGGVRSVAVNRSGRILTSSERPLPGSVSPGPGWVEQRAEDWLEGLRACLRDLFDGLNSEGRSAADVEALCVDSTSGTILPVADDGHPLGNALMYNDARAAAEADELNRAGSGLTARMGYRFNSSYGLAKILWIARDAPEVYEAAHFVNAADFLAGRLCGDWRHTDYTNALKMGYDLLNDCWPEWLTDVGLDLRKLPRVHRTGDVVGWVSEEAAHGTGLRSGTPVAIGSTDGVAALYASGATRAGESATTLGTTLVVKSVSRSILLDPEGRIYCHRHAEGRWLPGGAGNCGCAYATKFFPDADLDALGHKAAGFLPCEALLYPLAGKGERFPVVAPEADGFVVSKPSCEAEHFAAYLEGVAFVERWAYEIIGELGGDVGGTVFSSGGGSRGDVWMQVRADVLGRETARTEAPYSAFGSAVLAASRTMFDNVDEAVASLVREERRFSPDPTRHRQYEDLYHQFRTECARRGLA